MIKENPKSEELPKGHAKKVELDQNKIRAELFESNRRLRKEIDQLRENKKSNEQLSTMSAELLENLRSVEIRLHNIKHTAAWKIGGMVCSLIRKFRASIFGKTYFLLESVVKVRLKSYLAVRRQIRTVEQSGLFDSAYYVSIYPLIGNSIWTPLEHYMLHGEREGRQPNSVFRPYYYNQQVDDNKWGSPLVHFIKEGADNNLNPSPFFLTDQYRQKYLSGNENPLHHYLNNEAGEAGRFVEEARDLLDQKALLNQTEIGNTEASVDELPDRLQCEISDLIHEVEGMSIEQKLSHLKFAEQPQPEISVLIPFFNKLEYSVNCLYALHKQEYDNFEVIMVDDASDSDDCSGLAMVEGIKVIKNQANLGYLYSCNLAAREARGKYLVQLNNDTLPLQGWLENLLKTFKYHPDAGLVGSLMLDKEGLIQEAGGMVFNDASGYNYGKTRHPRDYCFNYCREVDYCSGASIIMKRDLWERFGGYDTLYAPAYYEDTDIAMQVRNEGLKVIYNPFSKIIHYEGVSLGTSTDSGIKKYQEINKSKFFDKWKDILEKQPSIPAQKYIDQYTRGALKIGKMLWIDGATPTPDQDSGSIDTVNFFHQALSSGWAVSFLPWSEVRHDGVYTENLQYMGVECIDGPSSDPSTCLEALDDSFDLVILSRLTVARYAHSLVRHLYPNAKVIFNTVDLHFLRYQREAELFCKSSIEDISKADLQADKDAELSLVQKCDATIVVSEDEKTLLEELVPGSNICVIPLFREVVGCSNSFEKRIDIGFIGGYQHPPNVDAVKYFVREIWPLVTNKMDGCRFIIAGSNVPQEISRLASENIEVRGFIPELSDLFAEVRLMVAPIRYGAGVKGKIVSGLCHGVPQVVSQAAAEGMGLKHNNNAMIAGSAEQFADQIINLYSDSSLWNTVSENALQKALDSYSKDAVRGKITALLKDMSVSPDVGNESATTNDHSKTFDCTIDNAAKLKQELEIFDVYLNVHDLPDIYHYWSNRYLVPMLEECGIGHPDDLYVKYMLDATLLCGVEPPNFVSVGSGNCDTEVRLAKRLREEGLHEFTIECLDLNPTMLSRGRELAMEEGVLENLSFTEMDFNKWEADKKYTCVIANQSLHHVQNLEGLFSEINNSMHENGSFITSDMIGRNGHQRWPDALKAVHEFWHELPETHRYNRLLQRSENLYENWDCSTEGFEGVRAQDILPLLIERFHFEVFIGFANVIDVFIDRSFGHNFDIDNKWDTDFIDRVHDFDEKSICNGEITPTHMLAVLKKSPVKKPFYSRGLTPEFCVRNPFLFRSFEGI